MTDFVSATEAAQMLGISRRALLDRVKAGTVAPALKLPGRTGAYLFDAEQIDALATDAAPSELEGAAS